MILSCLAVRMYVFVPHMSWAHSLSRTDLKCLEVSVTMTLVMTRAIRTASTLLPPTRQPGHTQPRSASSAINTKRWVHHSLRRDLSSEALPFESRGPEWIACIGPMYIWAVERLYFRHIEITRNVLNKEVSLSQKWSDSKVSVVWDKKWHP